MDMVPAQHVVQEQRVSAMDSLVKETRVEHIPPALPVEQSVPTTSLVAMDQSAISMIGRPSGHVLERCFL